MNGVVVIDKARGPTSHDVVAAARKRFKQRDVGHAGTLDPMATGVLVVALGEATKLVPYLTAEDKEYETTIALGVETDTLDAEGRETRAAPVPPFDRDALAAALEAERARTEQVPPVFSAIHVAGERAHARARRGETDAMAPRPVVVRAIDVIAFSKDRIDLRVSVGKGYYVRALARDLAERLGTVGHLTALRRLRSGAFTLDDACAIDDPAIASRVLTLEQAATRALPSARLTQAGVLHARHGRPVPATDFATGPEAPFLPDAPQAWLDERGTLIAVGLRREDGRGQVLRGFPVASSGDEPTRDRHQ